MIRLVRAELLKLRTTQVWFWLLLGAVAVTVLFVVGQIAPTDSVRTPDQVYSVFTAGGTAYIVAFVLGALGVTTEFRYKTITSAVLTTPSRWTLVTAKLVAYALVGAGYAVVCVLVQLAVALPWLGAKHLPFSLSDAHVPRALVGVFAVVALFGIVGLGFGALVRNQIVAISVGVIWLLILNNLLAIIPGIRHIYPYTPGGGVAAIFTAQGDRTQDGVTLLSGAGGIAVLLVWALVPAFLGAAVSMNRDIT